MNYKRKKHRITNEFILIFRNGQSYDAQFSPEQMKEMSKPWQEWIGSIAAQNKLANMGNRLGLEGATLQPNDVITYGPMPKLRK